ncbi:protein IQ-DOMAIN 19-like [Salvia divinorum]|uniref:Protein IQ-DOMAIN 19-like n=1 Tax=Salvia divinorum TaxID=28513 RepID=A0ABD1HZJ3_SALDI
MGKASKWIRNLLSGKRQDEANERGPSFPPEACTSTSLGIMMATAPKVKRRWGFKMPPSARPIAHKSSKESTAGVERTGKVASLGKGLLGEETNEYRIEVHPCCDGDSSLSPDSKVPNGGGTPPPSLWEGESFTRDHHQHLIDSFSVSHFFNFRKEFKKFTILCK